MSKIHVVAANGDGYQVYIHTSMLAGANLVANSWSACFVSAYSPGTRMTVGTGIGQITSSEAAQVAAGAVLEIPATMQANGDGTAPTTTQINSSADAIIAAKFLDIQAQLKYFGYTQ